MPKGLRLLNDARYHPLYHDHRVFPSLRQYHESFTLVDESLAAVRDGRGDIARIHDNFLKAVGSVTTGKGLLIRNWRKIPEQTSTNYAKVNLEISRLVAGELVGLYKVTVRANGRVPHHSHSFLDEHHLLPDAINGVHQLGDETVSCGQSDIVYISHGKVHAFRNDESEDRQFLFICGSEVTGPWDFVQDITTYPGLDFPSKTSPDLRSMGGRQLGDILRELPDKKRTRNSSRRLSPSNIALFHDVVCVEDEFTPTASATDLQYYMANGTGQLEADGNSKKIAKDDVFVLPTKVSGKIVNHGGLILYQFGRAGRTN